MAVALINGRRVRVDKYKVYWIPRADPVFEKYMDKHFVRINNQRRWAKKSSIWNLKDRYVGQPCHIVGKGPSLDDIKIIPAGPIIALNEAVIKIESLGLPNRLFGTQIDPWLGRMYAPKQATMLLVPKTAQFYPNNSYVINPFELGLLRGYLSALFAVNIAKHLGCTELNFWAFDACVTGNCDYANCIKDTAWSKGQPFRFIKTKRKILATAGKIPVIWQTTGGPIVAKNSRKTVHDLVLPRGCRINQFDQIWIPNQGHRSRSLAARIDQIPELVKVGGLLWAMKKPITRAVVTKVKIASTPSAGKPEPLSDNPEERHEQTREESSTG